MNESDVLLNVYIGQEISYTRGILYKFKDKLFFNEEENKTISSLINKSLIHEKQPYAIKSINTLETTKLGDEEAKKRITEILKDAHSLIDQLSEIPKKALGFLLINLDEHVVFQENKEDFFLDWKEFVLYNSVMFDYSLKLCKTLESYKLAVFAHDYVSTNGGRVDPEKYVIAGEVVEFITKNLNPLPFDYEETKQALLIFSLYEIENAILSLKDEDRRRNNYWNLLRGLPFDESAIKALINQFSVEKITTEYSDISNERFLFSVIDKPRYKIKIERMLDTFISKAIEGKKADLETLTKPSELLKIHAQLFATIGNFEMQFREGLIKEMRSTCKENKGGWYERLKEIKLIDEGLSPPFNTLYDKLESRKEDDIRNKLWPESELIYYADIVDYKDIILSNWSLFESKMKRADLSKEKFEHGMNELNKVRRKVMHLRDIRPHEAKTLRLYIIPELEKIFR